MSEGDALGRVRRALEEKGCQIRGKNAQCPAHEDRTASFGFWQGNRGVVIKCLAGCENAAILDALGLTWGDLFDESRGRDYVPVRERPWDRSVPFDPRRLEGDGFARHAADVINEIARLEKRRPEVHTPAAALWWAVVEEKREQQEHFREFMARAQASPLDGRNAVQEALLELDRPWVDRA